MFNDVYAKDISKKISSAKHDKQRKGLFIGGKPVYGYKMHPTEKNKIVIDEDAALNCPPFVRQYGILLTSGVIYYAKRSSKQTVYARVQEKGHRNYAAGKIKLQRDSP